MTLPTALRAHRYSQSLWLTRRRTVTASSGNCIVELGCGTGINFAAVIKQIGLEGRLIGGDLSPGMLECAQERVERAGWRNVDLVQDDITAYRFPEGINVVLSTGVFGYIEDGDRVIKAAWQAIVPGGRLVILDGKRPDRLPLWIFTLIVWASRPFDSKRDYFDKRTWESVQRHFRETAVEHLYGGMIYISSGPAA